MGRKLRGKVVIATHNPGKLKEMRELLRPHGIETISAGDLGLDEPIETGTSFSENAIIKATAATNASRLPALADDSGLAVDALGGEPGIHSARWAGEKKDFAHAMKTVEEKLKKKRPRRRRSGAALSSPPCASPGPTARSRPSKAVSTERSCGRRAAIKVSATIRSFCPMVSTAPSAR